MLGKHVALQGATDPVAKAAGLIARVFRTRNAARPLQWAHYPLTGDLMRKRAVGAALKGCLIRQFDRGGEGVSSIADTVGTALLDQGHI